ncbi:MAG: tetratricopeptide repeat protein, partial [Desulfobacula sp.]|nr:tetratricopeptide repeat protein [Desulfobacula sp.]
MKKNLILILMTLFFCTAVFAQTQKEIFDNGVLLFKQGQYQNAIDAFSQLIEIAPDHADAYKNRGVSYMKLQKFDLAIKDFEIAKELFPELKGLYSNLGVAWY